MKPRLEKPDTQEQQIDSLWDVVTNHILARLTYHDLMLKGLIALGALGIALMAVIISRV